MADDFRAGLRVYGLGSKVQGIVNCVEDLGTASKFRF